MAGLRFALTGPAEAPAVVLLHGFMGSRQDWTPIVERLAPRFRCLAVDLPGHGETGDPGDERLWSVEGCAAAVVGLLDYAGIARAAVAGYSLGGRLALHAAFGQLERFSAAVLISASPGLADEGERASRRESDEQLARRLETAGLEAFLESWYRQPLFAPLREHPGYEDVLLRRRENDTRLLARSLRTMGLGRQRSLWAELPRLTLPLLLLTGERDPKFSAIACDMVALSPRAEAMVLRGRGHALVEEDPEAVAREIGQFYEGVEGETRS